MRERFNSNLSDINLSSLERALNNCRIDKYNVKTIMTAAGMSNLDEALKKLDTVTREKNVYTYHFMDISSTFIRSGTFSFVFKVMCQLIGKQETINKLTGYGSLTDKMLDQLDEEDAIEICTRQLNWAGFSGISTETACAIKYLQSLDKEKAVALVTNAYNNDDVSFHTTIALICVYIHRDDVAACFNFQADLHGYIKALADKTGSKAMDAINNFVLEKDIADKALIKEMHKLLCTQKTGALSSMGLVALCAFNKSPFLAKFSAILLTSGVQIFGNRLIQTAKDEYFAVLNVNMTHFIAFINRLPNREAFLIRSNTSFVKYFAEDTTLNDKCIADYVSDLENTNASKDFVLGNCDMSELLFDFNPDGRQRLYAAQDVLEVYKALFGDNEMAARLNFLIKLFISYYDMPIEVLEGFVKYNANDDTIKAKFATFIGNETITDFNKSIISGKPNRKVNAAVAIFKGKTELIDELMSDYKNKSIESRFLLVLVLGDNLDTHFEAFSKINESSKTIQLAIAKVYKDNTYLADAELEKLKDKKQATRKSAFNLLKMAYGSKYNAQIEEAMEAETNEKLKLEMQDHLNTLENIDENDVNITKAVETLIKNRKKVEFAYRDMPEVRDINGAVATEEYLLACMVAYANEPVAGVSFLGAVLAKQLNESDFENFAQQAFYNFMDDGAEAKKKWAIYFSSIHGGFTMVETLKSQIAKWAENSRGAIAGEATKALALNPNPLALLTVDAMSRKYKFKQVKNAAVDAMEFAAEQLKITKEELSDRIVPNLGFDDSMKMVFDYGSRKFDVFLNTALELEVYDEKNKKIKSLPAVGKNDDADIASESLKQFKELKKQLKATVTTQRDRLDMALSDGRKWTKEAYENLFVKNPIMHQFAIGLVWGIYEDNKVVGSFRYMEDGSFNSSDEDEVELTEGMIIGILHPLEMDEELLSTWKEQLSDYEVIQPLVQLERDIYQPTDEEKKGADATAFAGKVMSPATLSNKMLAQGWSRGEIMDAGFFEAFIKVNEQLGICAQLCFSGTCVGYYEDGPCTTKQVKFYKIQHHELGEWGRKDEHYLPISEVNSKFYSEVLVQVAKATATSTETNTDWRTTR